MVLLDAADRQGECEPLASPPQWVRSAATAMSLCMSSCAHTIHL